MARRDEWFTPRASGSGQNCVETFIGESAVHVRDSKAPEAGTLTFTHAEWRAFIAGVRDTADYDLP